jgi:hypothetical protein
MKLTKDRIEENTSEEQKPFEVKSKFWLNRKVFTDIFGKKSISFDRNLVKDAFRSGNYQKAILITLAWGYPKAMRRFKPNEENIMLIKEILEGNRNLSKAELYQKFGGLSQIEGLGTSTLTKLLFF